MFTKIHLAAATIAAAACLAACGSSGDGHQHTAGAQPSGQPSTSSALVAASTPAPSTSAPAPANTLAVTAYDKPAMRYAISGHPRAGLVAITYRNAGDVAHEMSLVRLKPGVTLARFKAALHRPNGEQAAGKLLINPDGEITGPPVLGPGLGETASVRLVAGHYVVICFLPGEHGMPHALIGMVADLTVAAAPSAARPPATDGTVTLTDSKILLPAGFTHGGTFAITNRGTRPHDLSLARLRGATLLAYFQCVNASFGKGTPIDTCPGVLAGGITSVPAGQTAYVRFAPPASGTYGYVSTEGDGADFKAGLNGTFRV